MTMTMKEARALIRSAGKRFYCYILLRPDGRPFYVGVGQGRRILDHENPQRAGVNRFKRNIIAKIKAEGGAVGYEIAGFYYTRPEADGKERELIKLHGRADLGTGILCNLTDGGEGTFGARKSAEEKARLAAAKKGRPLSEAHRAALKAAWAENRERRLIIAREIGEKLRGREHSDETKAKIGAAHKGRKRPPEIGIATSSRFKGKPLSPEHRAKLSAARMGKPPANKGQSPSAETRARMSAAHQGWRPSREMLAAGTAWREANAASLSARRKALWADPEYRRMMKLRRRLDEAE